MKNSSETGHGKNMTNFDDLISTVDACGKNYDPTKPSIKRESLLSASKSAKMAADAVNSSYVAYTRAVAVRETGFATLSGLVTRMMNALKATDAIQKLFVNARTLVRKIQGRRAKARKTEEELKAMVASGEEIVEISSSQMSFDSRLDNFERFINFLSGEPLYAPNEPDLQLPALTALLNDLRTKNRAVAAALTELNNARSIRNEILYKANTGLVDTAFAVKNYIKSVYGANSTQYRQATKLEFRTLN